jgi:glucosamine 6-phosphate synthetase-like amidotransferase/phosphosugar isomerase protein
MCVAIIICNVVGVSYSVKVNYKREKLNHRYEKSIDQLDNIVQKYIDMEPLLRKAAEKFKNATKLN